MIRSRAIDSDPRLQRMYRQIEERRQALRGQQRELARQERTEARQLHTTRSHLDEIASQLDHLPPARISSEAAFQHVLRHLQLHPQKMLADFGGWPARELQAVAEVYSLTVAD